MTNNRGTLILFYNTIICYLYSAVMIWVFYHIPKQHGRAVTTSKNETDLLDDILLADPDIEQEEKTREMINAIKVEE